VENQKKAGYLGDPARGQADPRSATVYTMDWPGPVICINVCVGTVPGRIRNHRSTCCGSVRTAGVIPAPVQLYGLHAEWYSQYEVMRERIRRWRADGDLNPARPLHSHYWR
jgi:hypothetical protein